MAQMFRDIKSFKYLGVQSKAIFKDHLPLPILQYTRQQEIKGAHSDCRVVPNKILEFKDLNSSLGGILPVLALGVIILIEGRVL